MCLHQQNPVTNFTSCTSKLGARTLYILSMIGMTCTYLQKSKQFLVEICGWLGHYKEKLLKALKVKHTRITMTCSADHINLLVLYESKQSWMQTLSNALTWSCASYYLCLRQWWIYSSITIIMLSSFIVLKPHLDHTHSLATFMWSGLSDQQMVLPIETCLQY